MNTPHEKPFTLAPVKSPEEIAQEAMRKMAPQLRTAARALPISAAAKFFYYSLLDLTFLHCYGGSGRGKIFISIKDLSRLLNHNKDSITSWRDILVSERLIWVRESWPKSEWRICGMCPAPVSPHNGSEADYIRGKAASFEENGETGQSGNLPLCGTNGENHVFGPNPAPSSDTKRKDSASPSEGFRESGGNLPLDPPKDSVGKAGFTGETVRNLRTDSPKDSALLAESAGHSGGNLPLVSPRITATLPDGTGSNKESPLGGKEKVVKEGVATPPVLMDAGMRKWLGRLDKMFPRELEKVKSDLRKALPTLLGHSGKETCRWKLKQVEERLTGPQPDESPAAKAPQPAKVKQEPIPLAKRRELLAKARKQHGV